jgi:hypothetical protein
VTKQEIGSELLVEQMNKRKESPWATRENGRPLTQYKLSVLLRDFDNRPGYVGHENDRKRGHRRLQFTESWEAYLRAQDPVFPGPPHRVCRVCSMTKDQPVSTHCAQILRMFR